MSAFQEAGKRMDVKLIRLIEKLMDEKDLLGTLSVRDFRYAKINGKRDKDIYIAFINSFAIILDDDGNKWLIDVEGMENIDVINDFVITYNPKLFVLNFVKIAEDEKVAGTISIPQYFEDKHHELRIRLRFIPLNIEDRDDHVELTLFVTARKKEKGSKDDEVVPLFMKLRVKENEVVHVDFKPVLVNGSPLPEEKVIPVSRSIGRIKDYVVMFISHKEGDEVAIFTPNGEYVKSYTHRDITRYSEYAFLSSSLVALVGGWSEDYGSETDVAVFKFDDDATMKLVYAETYNESLGLGSNVVYDKFADLIAIRHDFKRKITIIDPINEIVQAHSLNVKHMNEIEKIHFYVGTDGTRSVSARWRIITVRGKTYLHTVYRFDDEGKRQPACFLDPPFNERIINEVSEKHNTKCMRAITPPISLDSKAIADALTLTSGFVVRTPIVDLGGGVGMLKLNEEWMERLQLVKERGPTDLLTIDIYQQGKYFIIAAKRWDWRVEYDEDDEMGRRIYGHDIVWLAKAEDVNEEAPIKKLKEVEKKRVHVAVPRISFDL